MTMELIDAVKTNRLAKVEILFRSGNNINQSDGFGYTGLIWACQKGNLDMVTLLVGQGKADLMVKDNNGASCLYRAAKHNHLPVVRYLSEKNPHLLHESDYEGRTPLWTASFHGHDDIVKFFFRPYYLQALYYNYPKEVEKDGKERRVKALCPGFDPDVNIDWKGCYVDPRTFAPEEGITESRFNKMVHHH